MRPSGGASRWAIVRPEMTSRGILAYCREMRDHPTLMTRRSWQSHRQATNPYALTGRGPETSPGSWLDRLRSRCRTFAVRAALAGIVALIIVVAIGMIRARVLRASKAARIASRCRGMDPDTARRTIFVSLVARGEDAECAAGILVGALFERARYPARIHVGLCRTSPADDGRQARPSVPQAHGESGRAPRTREHADGDLFHRTYQRTYPHHGRRFESNIRVMTEEPECARGPSNAMVLVQRHLYRGQRYYATMGIDCRPCRDWDEIAVRDLDRAIIDRTQRSARAGIHVLPGGQRRHMVVLTMTPPTRRPRVHTAQPFGFARTDRVLGQMRTAVITKHGRRNEGGGGRDDSDDDGREGNGSTSDICEDADSDLKEEEDKRGDRSADRAQDEQGLPLAANGAPTGPLGWFQRGRPNKRQVTVKQQQQQQQRRAKGSGAVTQEQQDWHERAYFNRSRVNQQNGDRAGAPPTFAGLGSWSPRGLPLLYVRPFAHRPVHPFGTSFWHSDFSLCEAEPLLQGTPWDPWFEHLPLRDVVDWCTTIRLWTHGWDFYTPTRSVVHRVQRPLASSLLGISSTDEVKASRVRVRAKRDRSKRRRYGAREFERYDARVGPDSAASRSVLRDGDHPGTQRYATPPEEDSDDIDLETASLPSSSDSSSDTEATAPSWSWDDRERKRKRKQRARRRRNRKTRDGRPWQVVQGEREAAYRRVWTLLGMMQESPIQLGHYALGTARDPHEYIQRSGIDWLSRTAAAHAFVGMWQVAEQHTNGMPFEDSEVVAKYGSWARFLDDTDYQPGAHVRW